MFLVLSAALALPPTHGVGRLEVGQGTLEGLEVSFDGRLVTGFDRSTGDAFVVFTDDWSVSTLDGCTASSITTVEVATPVGTVPTADGENVVYVGCDNGQIQSWKEANGVITREVDDDRVETAWSFVDDSGATETGAIASLVWDGDATLPWLYAFQASGGNGLVRVFEPSSGSTDSELGDTYPALARSSTLANQSFEGNSIVFHHNSNQSTLADLGTGAVLQSQINPAGQLFEPSDLTLGTSSPWGTDAERGVFILSAALGNVQTVVPLTGFDVLSRHPETNNEWMVLAGDTLEVYPMSNGGLSAATEPTYVETLEESVSDIVSDYDYSFVATTNGQIQVLSAAPWVDSAVADPSSGSNDTVFTVSFQVSEEADWELFLGGDRSGAAGESLASGSTVGDETIQVDVTPTEEWAEGDSLLYIVAKADNLLPGHARVTYTIDTVPDTLVLGENSLGFDDGALELAFIALSAEDVTSYMVYVADESFEPGDFATGGPGDVINVTAVPGEAVTVPIPDLENGTTYYVAVRSVDAGGLESAMSNVVSNTPQTTFRGYELAGEEGGVPCSTGSASPGWLLGGLSLMAAFARRRRWMAGGLLLVSSSAVAGEEWGDMTRQVGNFEARYGAFFEFQDEAIAQTWGATGHQALQIEFGPQFTRFLELDVEAGYHRKKGTTTSIDGEVSTQETTLTTFPLGLSGTARLHILDEQLIVPYAKIGMDYLIFRDSGTDSDGVKVNVSGGKFGWHYGLGANLLLDVFQRGRASLLEAQTGINDTYLTFEYRRSVIDNRKTPWGAADDEGYVFSADMLTVGLKLDY